MGDRELSQHLLNHTFIPSLLHRHNLSQMQQSQFQAYNNPLHQQRADHKVRMNDALVTSKSIYSSCFPHCNNPVDGWGKEQQCYRQCARKYMDLRRNTGTRLDELTE